MSDEFTVTDVIIEKKEFDAICGLLRYSLIPTGWRFNSLTSTEQRIVKNQEMLDEIKSTCGE